MRQFAPQPSSSMSELKNPILDVAASFWDDDRYRAFRVCYQSMRQLDDIVDDLKVAGLADNPDLRSRVKRQLAEAMQLLQSNVDAPKEVLELRQTMNELKIPLEPWRRLVRSMAFDLEHHGFTSFLQFARYANGAAVAPASIFIHLIGLSYADGVYTPAPIDIFKAARPLAMFSYLTHILRDFRKDVAEGLEYIPAKMRCQYAVSADDWQAAGRGEQSNGFVAMIAHYHALADRFRRKSVVTANPVYPYLDEPEKFSLHLIWELYAQIHEAIARADFVLAPELIHPSTSDLYQRIEKLARVMQVSDTTLSRGLARIGLNRWRNRAQ